MKRFLLISILFLSLGLSAQICSNKLIFSATTDTTLYKSIGITNEVPTGNTSFGGNEPYLRCWAWTDNARGFPIYNSRNLFSFNFSSIPAGTVIASAKLYLYADASFNSARPGSPTFGTDNAGYIQKNTSGWNYFTGWNNPPSVDVASEKTLAQSTSTAQNYVVDITDFVQGWINNPSGNLGMTLRHQNETAYQSLVFGGALSVDSLKAKVEVILSNTNTYNSVSMYPDQSKGFKQLLITNENLTTGNISLFDFPSWAWTDNSHGYPSYNGRTLLQYNLANIPKNSTVISAKLYMYAKSDEASALVGSPTYGNNNAGYFQKITSSWNYPNTGWNNQPNVDASSQIIIPQSSNYTQDYVTDITSFVKGWVKNPTTNYGLLFRLQNETYYQSLMFESGLPVDSTRRLRLDICYSTALPLQLVSFKGVLADNASTLWWNTENDELDYFIVERSFDGKVFADIKKVSSLGSGSNKYSWNDIDLQEHTKIYYRLKFVDKDGQANYSNILELKKESIKSTITLYPNPAKKYFVLNFESNNENKVNIQITDITGRVVKTIVTTAGKGDNNITVYDIYKITKGTYLVNVLMGNELLGTQKLIVQ